MRTLNCKCSFFLRMERRWGARRHAEHFSFRRAVEWQEFNVVIVKGKWIAIANIASYRQRLFFCYLSDVVIGVIVEEARRYDKTRPRHARPHHIGLSAAECVTFYTFAWCILSICAQLIHKFTTFTWISRDIDRNRIHPSLENPCAIALAYWDFYFDWERHEVIAFQPIPWYFTTLAAANVSYAVHLRRILQLLLLLPLRRLRSDSLRAGEDADVRFHCRRIW